MGQVFPINQAEHDRLTNTLAKLQETRLKFGTVSSAIYRRKKEIEKQIAEKEETLERMYTEKDKLAEATMKEENEFDTIYRYIRDAAVTVPGKEKDQYQYLDDKKVFMHIEDINELQRKANEEAKNKSQPTGKEFIKAGKAIPTEGLEAPGEDYVAPVTEVLAKCAVRANHNKPEDEATSPAD